MREITTSYYRVAEVVKRRFWSMLPSESLKRSRSWGRPGYISISLTSIFLFLLLSDLQLAEGGLYGVLISGVARYGFHIYWCHVRHFQNHRFWGAPTNVCKIRLVVCCCTCFNMQMWYHILQVRVWCGGTIWYHSDSVSRNNAWNLSIFSRPWISHRLR